MSWIIICTNYIYVLNYCLCKLYLFIICLPFCTFWQWFWMRWQPYNWLLNIQCTFSLCYSQFLFYLCFFNNSISFSCFCLCSLLFASFRLAIFYNFSIALFAIILLRTPKFWKCAQLLATNTNYFQKLLHFFQLWTSHPSHSFFYLHVIF